MAKKQADTTSKSVNSWWPRFWAWLIDFIVVSVVLMIIYPPNPIAWRLDGEVGAIYRMTSHGVLYFLYWMIADSDGRRSIGKKAMGLRLVRENGKKVDIITAATSSFGKAFLLPLDFLIGVIARPGKKQRLFNIVSDTIVIRDK
jgi:uncharacterized RDD family membrane protein YckC